jgi:hypothetical protein
MRKTRPVRTSRVCLKGKPEIFTAYIEAIRPKWLDRTLAAHAVQVMRFQRWVTDGGLALNALPPRAIDLFDQTLAEQGLTRFTRATLRSAASCYTAAHN